MRQIAVEAPTVSIVPFQSASALARVDPSADRPPYRAPLRDVPPPSARRPAGPTGRSSRNTCLVPAPGRRYWLACPRTPGTNNFKEGKNERQSRSNGAVNADGRQRSRLEDQLDPEPSPVPQLDRSRARRCRLGLGRIACGTAQTGSSEARRRAKGRAGAAGETLFVAGFQWGPPTNFNPLAPHPPGPRRRARAS